MISSAVLGLFTLIDAWPVDPRHTPCSHPLHCGVRFFSRSGHCAPKLYRFQKFWFTVLLRSLRRNSARCYQESVFDLILPLEWSLVKNHCPNKLPYVLISSSTYKSSLKVPCDLSSHRAMACDVLFSTRLAHGDFALRPQARMASGTSSAWPCARPPAMTGEACNLFCLTIWEIYEQDFMIFHDISCFMMFYTCFIHMIIFLLTWPFEGYVVASHLLGWTSKKMTPTSVE